MLDIFLEGGHGGFIFKAGNHAFLGRR